MKVLSYFLLFQVSPKTTQADLMSLITPDSENSKPLISKFLEQNYAPNQSQENVTNYSFWDAGSDIGSDYFDDIISALNNVFFTYPNDSSSNNYYLDKKSEDSYRLFVAPDKKPQENLNVSKSGDQREDAFKRLHKSSQREFSYWAEFVFDGRCTNSRTKNFQNISEAFLLQIITHLMGSVNKNDIEFNGYSCEEKLRINISLERTKYEQNEETLYDSLESFVYKIYQRKFVFSDFTSSKFTVLEKKHLQPRTYRMFPFLPYGYTLLAFAFLIFSCALYLCNDYMIRKKTRVYLVSGPVVDAFEKEMKSSAKDLTFPNVYKTYPDNSSPKVGEGESLLTLNFDTVSDVQEEPYKVREKSHSVSSLQNLDPKNAKCNSNSRRGSSSISECFIKYGEVGASEYFRGVHYYYGNLEYNIASNIEADEELSANEDSCSEPKTPLQASIESLGVTRVEYVDGEEPSFKFETDL